MGQKKSELANQGILTYAAYVLEKTLHVSESLILQIQLLIKTNTNTKSQQLFKTSISIKPRLFLHYTLPQLQPLTTFRNVARFSGFLDTGKSKKKKKTGKKNEVAIMSWNDP